MRRERFADNGSSRIAYELCGHRGRRKPRLVLIQGLGFDRTGRLGGMVPQELAIEHPGRVDRLILACTTPGWPFAYPMPRVSVQRMTSAARPAGRGGASQPGGERAVA